MKKLFFLLIIVTVSMITSCSNNNKTELECATASHCEGKPHSMVQSGEWKCIDFECKWINTETCVPFCDEPYKHCKGETYSDGCGGLCFGEKYCPEPVCEPDCSDAYLYCDTETFPDSCSGSCQGTRDCEPTCEPDCSDAYLYCDTETFADGCGGLCQGTKDCTPSYTVQETIPTCTELDTVWKCGKETDCQGLYTIKYCCKYQDAVGFFKGDLIEEEEYFYCDEFYKKWNDPIKGSDYGQVYIFLGAEQGTLTQSKLDEFAEDLKHYMYEASYGIIDNINFITRANLDLQNPNFATSDFGKKIKAYYFIAKTKPDVYTYLRNFDSGIKWTLSSASWEFQSPWGWTTFRDGYTYEGDCFFHKEGLTSVSMACRTSAHELGHAIFHCIDNDGDMMRVLPDLNNNDVYPPICLEKIKHYMPQLVAD